MAFTSQDAAHEAGYPETLNGSPLRLTDINRAQEIVDVLMDRNPRMSERSAITLALKAFAKMYEFSRGAWRKRREVVLGGHERVVLRND